MTGEMAEALLRRRRLIEQRGDALVEKARSDRDPRVLAMGQEPRDPAKASAWRALLRVVAAYRDRYGITGSTPLGAAAITTAQQVDESRARMRSSMLTNSLQALAQAPRRRRARAPAEWPDALNCPLDATPPQAHLRSWTPFETRARAR